MQDRVPQARIYKVWNMPQWGTRRRRPASTSSRACSRRGKTLAALQAAGLRRPDRDRRRRLPATRARSASQFVVQATAQPGRRSRRRSRRRSTRSWRGSSPDGPTADELERAQDASASPASCAASSGSAASAASPTSWRRARSSAAAPTPTSTRSSACSAATPADVREAAKRWLSDGVYVLEVHPFPELDGRRRPAPTAQSCPSRGAARRPPSRRSQRATLRTACKLVVAERHAVPVVSFSLLSTPASPSDQFGRARHGAASPMDMLDEGTKTRNALQISDELAAARAPARHRVRPRHYHGRRCRRSRPSSTRRSTLFADVVLNPSFPAAELERLQKQQLAAIQQEKRAAVRHGAARPAAPPLRRRARLRDCRSPARAPRRRSRKLTRDDLVAVPRDLVQAQQRDAGRGRRHHAGRDPAEARGALRALEARRRAEEERRRRSRRRAQHARLPHRPARRAAVA